jgi:hypothetical protein
MTDSPKRTPTEDELRDKAREIVYFLSAAENLVVGLADLAPETLMAEDMRAEARESLEEIGRLHEAWITLSHWTERKAEEFRKGSNGTKPPSLRLV